jgi:hypothetical protein
MPRTRRVELGWGFPDRYPPMRSLSVAASLLTAPNVGQHYWWQPQVPPALAHQSEMLV